MTGLRFRLAILAAVLLSQIALAAAPVRSVAAGRIVEESRSKDDLTALRMLVGAREDYPRDDRIHFRIGYLLQKMNRRGEAAEAYTATIAIDSCHSRALNNLGNIRFQTGDKEAAVELYRKSIECDAGFHSPYYNLANYYREAGRLQTAEQYYTRALEINPSHARTHHNLALIYVHRVRESGKGREDEHYPRALVHLNTSCDLAPHDVLSHYNRAQLYELGDEKARAIEDYQAAIAKMRRESGLKMRMRQRVQALRFALRNQ